jgi:mRNA interferase MazF
VRKGDIRMVDLGPGVQGKARRPAVIVSNDSANETAIRLGHGSVTVVPVTPYTERLYPTQVWLRGSWAGLECDHKALLEQIRSVDVGRVGEWIGAVPAAAMMELNRGLKLHLGL